MKESLRSLSNRDRIIIVSAALVLIISLYALYSVFRSTEERKILSEKVSQLEEALRNSSDSLARAEQEKTDLVNRLNAAGEKNKAFATQLDQVNTTIETYERLSRTDPELLQKYSKVYFLNENYTPSSLTEIDTKYLYNKDKPLQFHDRAWPFLRNMLDAAAKDGVDLRVISAFRSFGTQASLKSSYKVTYGAGTANSFSADQGYSEHQLGTTLDFTNQKVGASFAGFDKTDAYKWLVANAYKYGFILSYPQNNAYYVYEPWHWRFVGLELAAKLKAEGKNFYDLDQREISSYLVNIFNNPQQ